GLKRQLSPAADKPLRPSFSLVLATVTTCRAARCRNLVCHTQVYTTRMPQHVRMNGKGQLTPRTLRAKSGRPRLTGQPRPPSATTYRIISAVGSCCEPASNARELLLISQMLELIAAWRSHGRCCRAAAQQCGAHTLFGPCCSSSANLIVVGSVSNGAGASGRGSRR